jgi:hypothetical protein
MAPSPFHRAVEALERAHRLALILLVGPDDRAQEARELFDGLLPSPLRARSYRIDRQGPDLLSFAESLGNPFPILFVHGFERSPPAQRDEIEIRLNLLRDAFAQHHLGLIFWLPRGTLESFLQHCPDLFAWRSLLAEVDGADLPISPIIAARRAYLSHLLQQTRLPEVLVELQVAADRASLPIDFQEWAVKTQRGLAVGPAGSGKTTALRTLAHRLADHAYDDATQPVPVLLHGGAFVPAWRFDADQVWPRGVDLGLAPNVLSTLAEAGQLIILFDGLDEVLPGLRGSLLDWITQLTNTYSMLRIIITTRISEPTPLGGLSHEWEVVHMQKLTQDQAQELADRLMTLAGVDPGQQIDLLAKDSSISRLPQFVQMLVSHHLVSGHLPAEGHHRLALDRVRFLSDLIDRRLMDFDEVIVRSRVQRADVLGYRDLRRALQQMALAAMAAGTTRIPRYVLSSIIPSLSSTESARENVEYLLISRSGLLQKKGGGFSFVHMSIQEYLAAERLVEWESDKSVEILYAHLADHRWSEVVAFTAALLEMRYSTGRKLLDALADHALRIPEAKPRATAFAVLLEAALGVDVWSDTLASLLQAARVMLEDPSGATYALEPAVSEAIRVHDKAS